MTASNPATTLNPAETTLDQAIGCLRQERTDLLAALQAARQKHLPLKQLKVELRAVEEKLDRTLRAGPPPTQDHSTALHSAATQPALAEPAINGHLTPEQRALAQAYLDAQTGRGAAGWQGRRVDGRPIADGTGENHFGI